MQPSEAFLNGWFAHKSNCGTAAVPYDLLLQAYSHYQWLRGWHARFDACMHGLDLTHDDVELF